MNGLTSSWVLVGIFLWGMPTGFVLSFLLASVSWDGGLHISGWQAETFGRNCLVLLPLFAAGGIGLGLTMGRMCERARRQ